MATVDAHRQKRASLMPEGVLWPQGAESTTQKLQIAKAEEDARVDATAQQLINESDPRTAFDLLTDWERVCGLPDKCSELTDTLADRRAAVVTKLTGLPSQTPAYYQAMALGLGYDVTITEFRPFCAGSGQAGEPVLSAAWAHAWQVNAPETTVQSFRADNATAGEPLRSWGNDKLECVIQQHAPAHTVTLFAYGS